MSNAQEIIRELEKSNNAWRWNFIQITEFAVAECQKQEDEKVEQLKTELDDKCSWLKQQQLELINQIIDEVFIEEKK